MISRVCEHAFALVICVLIPRYGLLAALANREGLLAEPVALAPEAGREQVVGEVSASAGAFGLVPGMRVGEALARCPELRLLPPDPAGARALWSEAIDRIEGTGAAVESESAGIAFFAAGGLAGIHGGSLGGVVRATRRALDDAGGGARPRFVGSAGKRGRGRLRAGARIGVGPSRFASYAAALRARPRRGAVTVPQEDVRDFLAPLSLSVLRLRPELGTLVDTLDHLGIRTLGELAELPRRAVAERFGHPGLLALQLARGGDTPLEPRRPSEPVLERLELPEAVSGPQLERALELLIARLLTRPERRGRSLRGLALSARLVEGGSWRCAVALRQATADPIRLRLTLSLKLMTLPAPAGELALEVEAFGPPAHEQRALLEERDPRAARRARLDEAVRQARQAGGEAAALRVLEIDPDSSVPERRAVLAPFRSGER